MNIESKPVSLTTVLSGCATLSLPTLEVPERLRPASDESVAIIAMAKGVQIYECRASKERPGSHEWVFVAPEADLFDARGNKIGKHYAGPHWEAVDGSKISGTVKERVDAPQANAIPWLLLTAKSDGGEGAFSKITSVQRVNTVGGTAPETGCSSATAGTVARVPYTADYYMFARRG